MSSSSCHGCSPDKDSGPNFDHLFDKQLMRDKIKESDKEYEASLETIETKLQKTEKKRQHDLLLYLAGTSSQTDRYTEEMQRERDNFVNPNRRPAKTRKKSNQGSGGKKGYYDDLKTYTNRSDPSSDLNSPSENDQWKVTPYQNPIVEEMRQTEDLETLYELAENLVGKSPQSVRKNKTRYN